MSFASSTSLQQTIHCGGGGGVLLVTVSTSSTATTTRFPEAVQERQQHQFQDKHLSYVHSNHRSNNGNIGTGLSSRNSDIFGFLDGAERSYEHLHSCYCSTVGLSFVDGNSGSGKDSDS